MATEVLGQQHVGVGGDHLAQHLFFLLPQPLASAEYISVGGVDGRGQGAARCKGAG